MICPECNGYKNFVSLAETPFEVVRPCKRCNGTGEIEMTEQEYIQTCNTKQLAEFLFRIAYMCSYCGDEAHSSQEKIQQCHFGKCGCQRKDWVVWLKQPHREENKK